MVAQSVERRTENPYVGGSIPPQGTTARRFAGVAQLAEQLICNQQVVGSIPITSSKNVTPFLRGKKLNTGGLQSGQMHQTVNLTSPTSVVRIHLLPPKALYFVIYLRIYPQNVVLFLRFVMLFKAFWGVVWGVKLYYIIKCTFCICDFIKLSL